YIRNQPEFFNFTPNCYLPNTDTFKRKPRNMLWWICGGVRNIGSRHQINFETGIYQLQKNSIPYFAVTKNIFARNHKLNLELLLGTTYINKFNLYVASRLNYNIHSKKIIPFRFSSEWNSQSNVVYHHVLKTNLGLEVSRSFYNETYFVQYYPHLEFNLF